MLKLCRYMRNHADEAISLDGLALLVGLSPSHLQRVFTQTIGVSPKVYADACRMQLLKGLLRKDSSASIAIVEAGFGSPSRIYEKIDQGLGMTPNDYRNRGKNLDISYAFTESLLGPLLMAATDRGICFVQFGESQSALVDQLKSEFPDANVSPMNSAQSADFEGWMSHLNAHLSGKQSSVSELPIEVFGTAFQAKVWRYLQTIPSGEIRSYTQIAEGIGSPKSVRAVANACGTNRIAVLIPCHRVLRGSGELSGYRWGVDRKRALLDAEASA